MIKKFEFEPESREIIGCAVEVHRALGPGFIESVYHNALTVSLVGKAIPFESESRTSVWFQGVEVGHHCLDLVVRESIVVELKAVERLADVHFVRLRSYLRATGLKVGLLVNFNAPTLVVRRIVNNAVDRADSKRVGIGQFSGYLVTLRAFAFSRFRDSSIEADTRTPLDSADVRWYFRYTDVE